MFGSPQNPSTRSRQKPLRAVQKAVVSRGLSSEAGWTTTTFSLHILGCCHGHPVFHSGGDNNKEQHFRQLLGPASTKRLLLFPSFVFYITSSFIIHAKDMRCANDATLGWCELCGGSSSLEEGCVYSKIPPTEDDPKITMPDKSLQEIRLTPEETHDLMTCFSGIPRLNLSGQNSIISLDKSRTDSTENRNQQRMDADRAATSRQRAMETKAWTSDWLKGDDRIVAKLGATASIQPTPEQTSTHARPRPPLWQRIKRPAPPTSTTQYAPHLRAEFDAELQAKFIPINRSQAVPKLQDEARSQDPLVLVPTKKVQSSVNSHGPVETTNEEHGYNEGQIRHYTKLYTEELGMRMSLETEVVRLECEKKAMVVENDSLARHFKSAMDAWDASLQNCRASQDSGDTLVALLKTCMGHIDSEKYRNQVLRRAYDEEKQMCAELKRENGEFKQDNAELKEMCGLSSEGAKSQQADVVALVSEGQGAKRRREPTTPATRAGRQKRDSPQHQRMVENSPSGHHYGRASHDDTYAGDLATRLPFVTPQTGRFYDPK